MSDKRKKHMSVFLVAHNVPSQHMTEYVFLVSRIIMFHRSIREHHFLLQYNLHFYLTCTTDVHNNTLDYDYFLFPVK